MWLALASYGGWSQHAPKNKLRRLAKGSLAFVASSGAVHSMDPQGHVYSYIQVEDGLIKTFDQPRQPAANTITLPAGAVVYPGFIDSHSHVSGFYAALQVDNQNNPLWMNLANVNVLQQQPCNGARDLSCFKPIQTQAEVIGMLKTAHPNGVGWILGFNYEPSRLACTVGNTQAYGFACPVFENQTSATPLQTLTRLRPKIPILITSESGHIAYINQAAFDTLNLCPPAGLKSARATSGCYTPAFNPEAEYKLAKSGQLDEDLAMYALAVVEKLIGKNNPSALVGTLEKSLTAYSEMGYTTVQEGAANQALIEAYMAIGVDPKYSMPVTVAILDHIAISPMSTDKYLAALVVAKGDEALMDADRDVFLAGIKVFADGSNQGFTGYMNSSMPYLTSNLNPPFTDSTLFSQPYEGLPDSTQQEIAAAAKLSHSVGLPLWVHSNGAQAQVDTVTALVSQSSAKVRDVVIHFTTPSQLLVNQVKQAGTIGVTFLTNDSYYYFQPLCQQIVGTSAVPNFYPAAWAQQAGLRFGLHSDTPVTPPDPLFGMWVATQRTYQQAPWLPPVNDACKAAAAASTAQKITPLQAMQAYTSNAAWLYGRDSQIVHGLPPIGSLQVNYAGDLVVLSADPLAQGADLPNIYVLYTVHNGKIVYQYTGTRPFAWPS